MRTWLILIGGMLIWFFHFLGSYGFSDFFGLALPSVVLEQIASTFVALGHLLDLS
jgi:hypothetical protein